MADIRRYQNGGTQSTEHINNACLPNLEPIMAAGINPKTGLPYKFGGTKCTMKEDIKQLLRRKDEQEACGRYVWYNLPCDITSQELERMLYYKGQLCFFYNKDDSKFYFTPYALDGTIDFYGRYNRIHPIPYAAGVDDKSVKNQMEYLSQLKLDCVYGLKLPEEITIDSLTKSTVLLHDYTKQMSQTILPRATIDDPLLDIMSNCIPYMNTSLLLATGIEGVRVNDADQAESVEMANRSMENAALSGNAYVPVVGNIEFQELNAGQVAKAEEYMMAMQSLDNFRKETLGLPSQGTFEKKSHMLAAEQQMNSGNVDLVLQDGLSIRQNFCNIVNSIWGLGIWCEPAECITNIDLNGDGMPYDRNETGENSGVESEGNDNE